MNFWDLKQPPTNIALIQATNHSLYTYSTLQTAINILSSHLSYEKKSLGFVFCRNVTSAIIGYLSALQNKHTVCLINDTLSNELAANLIDNYHPDWLWLPQESESFPGFNVSFKNEDYVLLQRPFPYPAPPLYPELAVLLSTSGSTGSPKLVRLSYKNLQANADSIANYLNLDSHEKPITSLPMNYTYGLSVINSHLNVGATLLLTDDAVITQEFWDFFNKYKATSLAGVPFTYQMLRRLRLDQLNLPTLKTLTQAGGRLDVNLQQEFADYAKRHHARFFVMYGQTEATARMSYVPPDKLEESFGSIGIPIPLGKFEIEPDSGELIYYGPNVMLGYAECRNDLALGDTQQGRLATGDLARQDNETGLFYITGRKKRFLKLLGLRINLDEIEQRLEQYCKHPCYCIGTDDHLMIIIPSQDLTNKATSMLTQTLRIHPSVFKIVITTDVPHLSTGKVDYSELQKRFSQ